MRAYARPRIPPVEFFDEAGVPLVYGARWGGDSPPEDSYSVTSNLERFAPLHAVADALVAWLRAAYEVDVEDDLSVGADVLRGPKEFNRSVRVTPRSDSAAALTFVYSTSPGVSVHAGLLHDFLFPDCGCDACDESWEGCADGLEWTVRTIVAGGYSEHVVSDRRLGVGYRLAGPGGMRSGSGSGADPPTERLEAARARLAELEVWAPWPERDR